MIQKVMQHYFSKPITRQEILRDKDRLVSEVEVDGETYFLKGEKQKEAFIENIIEFTMIMKDAGLPFIVPERTMEGNFYVKHDGLLFILEQEGNGEEIKKVFACHILMSLEKCLANSMPSHQKRIFVSIQELAGACSAETKRMHLVIMMKMN